MASVETKLLLTGAAGFGYKCAARSLSAAHGVLCLDNMHDYYDPALNQARLWQLTGHNGFSFESLDNADNDRLLDAF